MSLPREAAVVTAKSEAAREEWTQGGRLQLGGSDCRLLSTVLKRVLAPSFNSYLPDLDDSLTETGI